MTPGNPGILWGPRGALCQLRSAGHLATGPEWGQPEWRGRKVAVRDFVGRSAFCTGRASAAASLLNASFTEQPGRCEPPSTCHLSILVRLASRETVLKDAFSAHVSVSNHPAFSNSRIQHAVSEHFPGGPGGYRGLGTQRRTRQANPCCRRSLQGRQQRAGAGASAVWKSRAGQRRASGVCTPSVVTLPVSQDPPGPVRSPLSIFPPSS